YTVKNRIYAECPHNPPFGLDSLQSVSQSTWKCHQRWHICVCIDGKSWASPVIRTIMKRSQVKPSQERPSSEPDLHHRHPYRCPRHRGHRDGIRRRRELRPTPKRGTRPGGLIQPDECTDNQRW